MTASELFEKLPELGKNYVKNKKNGVLRFVQFYPELFQPGIFRSKKAVKLHQSTSAHNLWLSTSPHLMEKFIASFPELANLLSESAIHNATNSVVYVINNRDVSMFKLEWVLNNLSDSAASELSNIISNGTWSEVIAR